MAYAAITCLMRTIHQSTELTGCDFQPFYEKLESLRAILEKSCNITGDLDALLTSLEAEIEEVTYTTEDMVDSESRNVFLAQNVEERSRAMWELFFLLEQALECIDSTMKQWMATWDRCNSMKDLKAQTYSLASLTEHDVERPENIMVGHENEFEMMLHQLVRGDKKLEVVSIVGMGGIGKTTLATKFYSDLCIISHFDIRAKITISQEYCRRNVLLGLLSFLPKKTDESHEGQEDGQLADELQKRLKGNRYLIVIDDIWTTGAWDDIQLCFPNCNNGSRILLTTRNEEVAKYASSDKLSYHMRLLNFNESWSLLYEKVFAKDSFTPEFEQLGKQIALGCRGLPLAIVVIAGLLSKIGKALSKWQSVAENVSSAVSTDVDAQCVRVLALSYHYLPHHLKPCFLYFAIFPEDKLIYVKELVNLWAAEGFLKLEEMKSIEEVAEKSLKDLIDRSLIFIRRLSFDRKIVCCEMHDVIRELCLKEARNMNFVNVFGGKSYQNPCAQSMQCSSKSRVWIRIHNMEELFWYGDSKAHSIIVHSRLQCFVRNFPFKLLRVLNLSLISCPSFPREILNLIHLRYLALSIYPQLKACLGSEEVVASSIIDIPPLISSLCYPQNFKLYLPFLFEGYKYPFILPSEILAIPQLRQLHLDWNYLRYHEPTEKSLVLKNLHCLKGWNPRYCTGSFFRLFPNLKTLQIQGVQEDFHSRKNVYDFRYLDQLEELAFLVNGGKNGCFLESNTPSGSTPQDPLRFQRKIGPTPADDVPTLLLPPPDAFPQNLKKLTLTGDFSFPWEDLSIVGKLPQLEALTLELLGWKFGQGWEVVDEGFPRLKFLQLKDLDMEYWRARSDHFPFLERLFLDACICLDSIPQDFADITSLELIDITFCRQSVGNSAKQIQQDIQNNYERSIEVHISNPMGQIRRSPSRRNLYMLGSQFNSKGEET